MIHVDLEESALFKIFETIKVEGNMTKIMLNDEVFIF